MIVQLTEETGCEWPHCPICAARHQRLQILEAFARPWKYLHICNTCGAASEGRTPTEARVQFAEGNLTLQQM